MYQTPTAWAHDLLWEQYHRLFFNASSAYSQAVHLSFAGTTLDDGIPYTLRFPAPFFMYPYRHGHYFRCLFSGHPGVHLEGVWRPRRERDLAHATSTPLIFCFFKVKLSGTYRENVLYNVECPSREVCLPQTTLDLAQQTWSTRKRLCVKKHKTNAGAVCVQVIGPAHVRWCARHTNPRLSTLLRKFGNSGQNGPRPQTTPPPFPLPLPVSLQERREVAAQIVGIPRNVLH